MTPPKTAWLESAYHDTLAATHGTPIHVGVVTICGPIRAGTAYDPDRLAEVCWELATQEPTRFVRDRLIQVPN